MLLILNISALARPITPLSIIDCDDMFSVDPVFKVFVLEPATALLIVAVIFTLWPAKLAPKSSVNVLPVGDPPNVNIAEPSWLLPEVFKLSPTLPVLPEPVVIIDTAKSSSACDTKVSFVPAVIVASPLDDKVETNCLLTLKFVSVAPLFAVVFSVLTVVFGNLNIDIFCSGFCNLALLLVAIPEVVTSLPPTAAVNVNSVCDIIFLTVPVTVPPASFVNDIESSTFNSVVNLVPLPLTVAFEFATVMFPVNSVFVPFVASKIVSAVYVGEPAIPTCFVCSNSKEVTPLKPILSAWIVPALFDESPVSVSPAEKVPCTFDTTTVVWEAVGLPDCAVTFNDVVPSLSNNSKVFAVVFLTTQTLAPELTTLFTEYVPPVRVICWPSTNPCEDKVATDGLAAVIAIAAPFFAVSDITIPVAPEVAPVTFSPVV